MAPGVIDKQRHVESTFLGLVENLDAKRSCQASRKLPGGIVTGLIAVHSWIFPIRCGSLQGYVLFTALAAGPRRTVTGMA
ncbi:hypothetical protein PG993_014414 [Apiospora rasikravindrae]|uniref:Uncharacterized protein n=1 Tax=Apiospora rasikravindrae TaxID=990691 RepID=A0ABR1RMQ3_9PEZI